MRLEYVLYAAIAGYFVYQRRHAIKIPPKLVLIQLGLILTVFTTAVTTLIWAMRIVG
jgi:hypothetical protein